jgi:hypothetical protein
LAQTFENRMARPRFVEMALFFSTPRNDLLIGGPLVDQFHERGSDDQLHGGQGGMGAITSMAAMSSSAVA